MALSYIDLGIDGTIQYLVLSNGVPYGIQNSQGLTQFGIGGSSFTPGQLPGTTTNDSAAAGNVGEIKTASVLVGSALPLSTGTALDVTHLVLTPGDWDVSGIVAYHAVGAVIPVDVKNGISTTSGAFGALGTFSYDYIDVVIVDDPFYVTPVVQVEVPNGSTQNVYLEAFSDFSGGTSLAAYGFIRARRVR